MFLDLDDFCRALLLRRPSVAMVTWDNRRAMKAFGTRFGPVLRNQQPGTVVSRIVGANLDSCLFQEKLLACLARAKTRDRALLINEIETLAPAAARILNGYRERLSSFQAVVIAIRENRRRDFVSNCPDLMEWVGTDVARAEDLGPPLTVREVNASIRRLEKESGMDSEEFRKRWNCGELDPSDDYWLWNELIDIRTTGRADQS